MKKRQKTQTQKSSINNFINHIVFVVDRSGSMDHLSKAVVTVFDNQIKLLARRSTELDQETRASVYLFDNVIDNIIYDKDVLRLPSLKNHYSARASTALIDATIKGISDLQQTPELYGDHAFLVYVLTDGDENASRARPNHLASLIQKLPEHWTVAALVPDRTGLEYAKRCGFPENNISVWSTTSKGLEDVGKTMEQATENFMVNRSKGIRGSRSLFQMDTSSVTKRTVKAVLDPLKAENFGIYSIGARDAIQIRDYVEKRTKKSYIKGNAYYQLVKPETIQSYKSLCLKELSTGKIYTGDAVRDLLGLPDYETRVAPADHPQFTFFIQSTSYNRKLVPGTELLVIK